ncbi:MAG: class I SAM-dependent methyltransferase [Thermoleophilia bacterium]|nr:class I SAM-dependent methyltransferase [Thermoleophilia bacterium]
MHEPAEKNGLRTAWGRVADAYGEMWAGRTAHITDAALGALAPEAGAEAVDVACGPGSTTVALADRLRGGHALGVDFAPEMVARAQERFGGRTDVAFAVDDAERLVLAPESVDVLTCSFGLMYCYDAAAALHCAARTLRPGGRMMQVVWGRAADVWWVPVIELIETRAQYFSAVCPMMFFYGLPGVMPRMVDEAGLDLIEHATLATEMAFPAVDDAVEAAIQGAPLAGLFNHRLDADSQAEVREAMRVHVDAIARPAAEGIRLPAQAAVTVAGRPACRA